MFLIRLLDQLRRSQEYWSLSTIPFDVADKTVADLRGLRDTLLELEVSYRENQGQNLKPINDLRYSVSQSSHPEAFTDFIKGDTSGVHSICFAIEEANFIHAEAGLLISDVRIDIPQIKTSDNTVTVDLIHSGRATLRGHDRELHYYTHKPRITSVSWGESANTPSRNLLGGDEEYAYLSPYAVWKLILSPKENVGLDLANVKEVNFTFNGLQIPFSKH